METVHRDFSPLKVKFYYVYKALAHPERDGLVQPANLDDRLLHIKEAQRRLNTRWTWLADAPDNQVKTAFGNRNNSEFVIDPKGNIVRARTWSSAEDLRDDLTSLVGTPKTKTTIADLNLKQNLPSNRDAKIASNVLPRIEAPKGSQAIQVKAVQEKDHPVYLKLRVDADAALLSNGSGKMRLGFWLDPIHTVHWNNLAEPLKFGFIIDESEKATFSPQTASAPKVKVAADYDPREFLIDVKNADLNQPLKVRVSYFPCHDIDEWCRANTQVFEIHFKADPHAGRTQSEMSKRRREGGPSGKAGARSVDQLLSRFDSDKDGKISKKEVNGRLADRFTEIDGDHDGFLNKAELKAHTESRKGR